MTYCTCGDGSETDNEAKPEIKEEIKILSPPAETHHTSDSPEDPRKKKSPCDCSLSSLPPIETRAVIQIPLSPESSCRSIESHSHTKPSQRYAYFTGVPIMPPKGLQTVHLPDLTALIARVIDLVRHCPQEVPIATRTNKIFEVFSGVPCVSPGYEEEGIWYDVDSKLNACFGIDNYKHNIMRGSLGIELVVKYISLARDHPQWTLDSDKLLMLKVSRIEGALIGKCSSHIFYISQSSNADQTCRGWRSGSRLRTILSD